jgi:UDP-glucose 4-epimerase
MELDGLKALVTGGAGFIGSHIVDDLVASGAKVRVLDNFSSGYMENLEHLEGEIEVIREDVLDFEALLKAAKGVDVISHQAAQLEIIRCIETPVEDLRSNAEGTLNVLEVAKQLGIPKVVYASSACVYGQAQYVPQDEDHPTVPNWPYGVSKLAAEHYARLYSEYYGIDTIGLRYSIVYGPREWYGRVLTAFLRRALNGEPPVVWGGDQERDFIYVKDVAHFNRFCIELNNPGHSVFNVSTGIGTSIRQLAELTCELFDLETPIYEDVQEGEVSKLVEGRMRLPSELRKMILANEKARQIGWKPVVSLQDGILREMEWLKGNKDRWTEMHY